ncbi:DNA endonuclease RBBP8 [Ditylenchus destructor]|nr:DNA endonuclease RBBP8 [Ditylenchus destructor]
MDKFVIRRPQDLNTSGEWLSTKKPPKPMKKPKRVVPKLAIRQQSNGDSLPQSSSSEPIVVYQEEPPIENTSDTWENMIKDLRSPTFCEENKCSNVNVFDRSTEKEEAHENCSARENRQAQGKLPYKYESEASTPFYALNTSPLENQQVVSQDGCRAELVPFSSTPLKSCYAELSPDEQKEVTVKFTDDSPFFKTEDLNTSGEWLTTTKPPKVSKKSKSITSKSPVKYQKSDSHPQCPSSSRTESSLNLEKEGPSKENLPDPWEKLVKELCSPTFQEEHKNAALKVFDRDKEITNLKEKCVPVRNAESRAKLMHGYECRCCAPYYDALNLTPGERQRRINQVSRHRGFQPIPSTPERYWDIEFPTTQEQRNFGLVVETDSPLFKNKPKRRVSRNNLRKVIRKSSGSRKSLAPPK